MTIAGLEPQSVLLGFGLVAIATGLYFRTPMPVQPMKAIATTAIAHPQIFTPASIWLSAVVTGAPSGSRWPSPAPCPGWRH